MGVRRELCGTMVGCRLGIVRSLRLGEMERVAIAAGIVLVVGGSGWAGHIKHWMGVGRGCWNTPEYHLGYAINNYV